MWVYQKGICMVSDWIVEANSVRIPKLECMSWNTFSKGFKLWNDNWVARPAANYRASFKKSIIFIIINSSFVIYGKKVK